MVALDINAEKAAATAADLKGDGYQCDVSDRARVWALAEEIGPVQILVNNAGIIRDGLFVGMSPDDWNAVLDSNLGGVFNFCRALAYPMMKRRKGRIINLSSVAAEHVNLGQCNYSASKGAINSLTRALAIELASRGVTVNAIAPGFIDTDMSAAVRNKAGDQIKKFIPMRRIVDRRRRN